MSTQELHASIEAAIATMEAMGMADAVRGSRAIQKLVSEWLANRASEPARKPKSRPRSSWPPERIAILRSMEGLRMHAIMVAVNQPPFSPATKSAIAWKRRSLGLRGGDNYQHSAVSLEKARAALAAARQQQSATP